MYAGCSMSDMTIEPVARPASLTELAYQQLKSKVLSGAMLNDERLSVVALAERMQMSRSPVRAAVERLATEGLLQLQPAGVSVIRPTVDDLLDALQVRAVLEGLAARLATPHMDPQVLRELEETHTAFEDFVSKEDVRHARVLDLQFHQQIMARSANPMLIEQLDLVQARVIVGTYSIAWSSQQKQAVVEHRALLDALAAGDPAVAEKAAVSHMEELMDRIRSAFSKPSGG